ncbi:hypothetical protein EJB05_17161, partial [Eragrostis curvula]
RDQNKKETSAMASQKDLFDVSGPTYLTHELPAPPAIRDGEPGPGGVRPGARPAVEPAGPRRPRAGVVEVLPLRAAARARGRRRRLRLRRRVRVPAAGAPPGPHGGRRRAPHYVVAFRGTVTKKGSLTRDLELDLQLVRNGLEGTSRFRVGMQAIRDAAAWAAMALGQQQQQHDRVWLAGHSLGSAISTLAAKAMARAGATLPTFLFNAPFVSAPVEQIGDKRVRQGIRIASSFVTAGVAAVLQRKEDAASFAALAAWVPNVFVNPADPISAEYVGYFDHRRKMEEIGAGGVGRLATRHSVKDLLLGIGKGGCEPLHLFPSAVLTVNRTTSPDFKAAHGIHQWWRPDLSLECTAHYYS